MKAYAREKIKDETAQLTADQAAACKCHESAVVKLRPLTSLDELLIVHPAPWKCEGHKAWRGKQPPEPVIYDARWEVVDLCDDPAWRPAIVQAVNAAAGARECDGK